MNSTQKWMNAPFVFQLGGWLKIEATKYGIIHVIGGLQEVAISTYIDITVLWEILEKVKFMEIPGTSHWSRICAQEEHQKSTTGNYHI